MSFNKKNKMCCILARVSTEIQSLDSQIEKLVDEAKRMGYDNDHITIISGKESGVKLDIEERQTINELKRYIDTGEYNMVLIWEVSRLARRPKVLYEVREYLIKRHVNLRCITPSFSMLKEDGTIDPTASIVFALFGTMAEEEARLSKQRMIRGRLAKREQCKFIGGNILFGYKIDDTEHIIIDKDDSITVIEIFERYIQNESIRSIAKDLLDRGRLKYDDYSTACVMLRRMIRRSEYAGIKGNTYDYPPIISQQLYNKVRARAESKNKYKTRVSGIYFGQGILHWKFNNMLMSPNKAQIIYRAWDENTNTGTMVNLNTMDALIWHNVLMHREKMKGKEGKKMILNIVEKMQANIQKLEIADSKIYEINETIERINTRVVKGKMSEQQGDRLIEEEKSEFRRLVSDMKKWNAENKIYDRQIDEITNGTYVNYNEMNDEQKHKVIKETIDRIILEKDGISSKGKLIDFIMKDGTEYHWHLIKRGNYPVLYIIDNGEEKEISVNIEPRFIRKGAKMICK